MFDEMIALMDKGLGIRTVPGHYPGALITLHPAMTRRCRFRFMTGPPTEAPKKKSPDRAK
jgi:hypothetical protein